jgi:RNA polymerase sigma-70 factor (family 1)
MADYRKYADEELSILLNKMDHKAFSEIYERYWALLFRHARRMLKDEEQAADLLQDLFTSIWYNAGTVEIKTSLSTYLYSGIRNRIIKLIRHEKVKRNYMFTLVDFLTEGHNSTDEAIREKELRQQIEREIAHLPEKMREIFELSRKSHLSYKEIADQVNISEGTVKKQVYNALKVLRMKLGALFFLMVMHAILLLAKLG